MEDAETRRALIAKAARIIAFKSGSSFEHEVSGSFFPHAEALYAAGLLQPPQPAVPEPAPLDHYRELDPPPLALERLPEILASLKRMDEDLFTELNERCGALEARVDSLEARNQPLGVGPGRGDRYVRDEDRHQGLSDPMG